MQICRTRFCKDIITEFAAPKNRKSRKVMIFCSGLPSAPCKDDVLEFWAKKGYWTFFPRYRGTWESDGVFLKYSLEKDVFDVIDGLAGGFKDYWGAERYHVDPKFICVVGSSFGGPAAILSTLDPRVNKAICMAPVVNWKKEDKSDPLSELYKFVRQAYGPVYRLNKTYWNKLARGKFYNPVHHLDELDGSKMMIFHAKDDEIVRFKPVAKFAKMTQSTFVPLNKGGHVSSSMLMEKKYYAKVRKFLLIK